jgi:beta-mannosidase
MQSLLTIPAVATACAALLVGPAAAELRQSLGSPTSQWAVTGANGSSVSIPASVPGSIHLDLLQSGAITDPNYGWNEVEQRWIAFTNWTYATLFNVSAEMLASPNVDLVLPGVDTAASVVLNGAVLSLVDNMHRTWRLPAKALIASVGPSTLEIAFTSPISYSASQLAECTRAAAPYCPPPWAGPAPNPIVNNAYIRKEQDSFSWDFAPATGTSGVWRTPYLSGYSLAVFAGAVIDTVPSSNSTPASWTAKFRVRLYSSGPGAAGLPALLSATIPSLGAQASVRVSELKAGFTVVSLDVPVASPELWWPNGYGSQPLYNCTLTLTSAERDTTALDLRIGFRTIVLDQPAVPGGNLFRFVVNGLPILARGSNWSPPDSLQGRITSERVEWLLTSFAAAGYNMLRVWGGGVYASDEILDRMDELGLLVYHDAVSGAGSEACSLGVRCVIPPFMACGVQQFGDQFYPVEDSFM